MRVKADYHLHPNLSRWKYLTEKKCQKWYKAFHAAGVNCVLITEHVYKNPRHAFEQMKRNCPADIVIFPGMEYVTKEGIDLIIFSQEENIYDYPEINRPFNLSYRDTVNFIKCHPDLHTYVTHPFTLGQTSIIKKINLEAYFEYVNELNSVEIANGAFEDLLPLFKLFPLSIFSKNKVITAEKNRSLPKKYYPRGPKFLAVGSDAHLPDDVGMCAEVEAVGSERQEIFTALISNKQPLVVYRKSKNSARLLIHNSLITIHEFLIKKYLSLWDR